MPSVINFSQPQHVAVLVDGIADGNIVTRMIREVQRVFCHIVGGWKVTLSPSARGEWRLELRGTSGRHVWRFAAPVATLPAAVADKLEGFLRDSARGWYPRPVGV